MSPLRTEILWNPVLTGVPSVGYLYIIINRRWILTRFVEEVGFKGTFQPFPHSNHPLWRLRKTTIVFHCVSGRGKWSYELERIFLECPISSLGSTESSIVLCSWYETFLVWDFFPTPIEDSRTDPRPVPRFYKRRTCLATGEPLFRSNNEITGKGKERGVSTFK